MLLDNEHDLTNFAKNIRLFMSTGWMKLLKPAARALSRRPMAACSLAGAPICTAKPLPAGNAAGLAGAGTGLVSAGFAAAAARSFTGAAAAGAGLTAGIAGFGSETGDTVASIVTP